MVIWYLVWNNPLKTSMSLSLCICQTSLWDSSLEGREKFFLFEFILYPQKNLHPVANSSNKETNSTDFLTWSWHISIIFGWQANISQTSPQSTEFRHVRSTAEVGFIFAWYVCFVLLPWICFPTFWAPDITVDVSKSKEKHVGNSGGGGGVVSHGIWSSFPELLYFCFKKFNIVFAYHVFHFLCLHHVSKNPLMRDLDFSIFSLVFLHNRRHPSHPPVIPGVCRCEFGTQVNGGSFIPVLIICVWMSRASQYIAPWNPKANHL